MSYSFGIYLHSYGVRGNWKDNLCVCGQFSKNNSRVIHLSQVNHELLLKANVLDVMTLTDSKVDATEDLPQRVKRLESILLKNEIETSRSFSVGKN